MSKDDAAATVAELLQGSDRAVALIGASMVDRALQDAIASRLVTAADSYKDLFENQVAPLSTFSSKIVMGLSLGIYGDRVRDCLSRIRRIRNVFAHSATMISFSNELITLEIGKLPEKHFKIGDLSILETKAKMTFERYRYYSVCGSLYVHFIDYFSKHKDEPKLVWFDDDWCDVPTAYRPTSAQRPHPDHRIPD